MGRRALRKLDPTLDLSSFLVSFDGLPHPWHAGELFGRQGPVEVDVGCGKGLFLATAGAAQPDTDFLGIEVAFKYAEFAAARMAKRNLTNVRVASADAGRIFSELLPDESLAAVHVYFPDPWWKARHKKRRVMNERFLGHVERTLQPGGSLHFWTDVEEYFETTLELIAAHTSLEGPLPVAEKPAEHDLDYRTNFERRVRQDNGIVHRAEFRR